MFKNATLIGDWSDDASCTHDNVMLGLMILVVLA